MTSRSKATRESRSEGFGRYSRIYTTPDGQRYPSVTTILGAIAKPALINWAAKTERELVLSTVAIAMREVKGRKLSQMAFMNLLNGMIGEQKQHARLRNKAGDIGSHIHALAEWTLRQELQQKVGPRPEMDVSVGKDALEAAEWGFMAWEDWRKQTNLVPKLIEQNVWSDTHKYAGTFDLYCEMDLPIGGRGNVVTDWKSGKGIYIEASLQIAAYKHALVEMGHAEEPLHGLVVRVPKVVGDPDFETRFVSASDSARLFKTFLHVNELWRFLDEEKAL